MVEVARIARSHERFGQRFLDRVYTEAEQRLCAERPASLAARWAAKEAVAKALGCGIGDIEWREIEVLTDERGAPLLRLHGAAARLAKGGLFVFSTETLPAEALAGRSFMVGPKQRFAHGESYILAGLAGHGFECLLMQPIVVRFDEGEPIHGHLVLAQRA